MNLLLDDCDQHIGGHRTPYLRFDRVFAGADKFLDAQMLFDPFEKQFHLPTALVESGNGQRRQGGVVGQKHKILSRIRSLEADTPQQFGIVLPNVVPIQGNALIADNASLSVRGCRVQPVRVHVALGSGDKESARLMQSEQAAEIQIAPIHDVESPGLDSEHVQHIDFVNLAVRDVYECGNVAAQIQQGMQFHSRPGSAKRSPWKQRQAKTYGGGIQGVNSVVQIDAKTVVAVQLARPLDEQCGEVCPDAPVAPFVGIRQCRAPYRRAKTHGIKFRLIGQQTRFDVPQAFSVGQLREGHGPKLLWVTQGARVGTSSISGDDARKTGPGNKLHELCKYRLSSMHGVPPVDLPTESYQIRKFEKSNSNRHQKISPAKPRQCLI